MPPPPAVAAPAAATPRPPRPAKRAGLSFRERGEPEGMEARIETAEAEIKQLQTRLAAPGNWSGPAADGPALTTELAAREAAVADMYARWEDLLQRT